MSAETDKRCGTCKWWHMNGNFRKGPIGDCTIPLPDDLPDSIAREPMLENEGADCPCWEPKQCAESESFQDYSKRAIAKIAEDNGLTVEQLTAKIMQPVDLVIDSPEGPRLVATYEFRPKQ